MLDVANKLVDDVLEDDLSERNQILEERYVRLDARIRCIGERIIVIQDRITQTRKKIHAVGGYTTSKKWNTSLCKRVFELEMRDAALTKILLEMVEIEKEIC